MTASAEFDRMLATWFESDAAAPVPAAGLDRAIEATRIERPRGALLARWGSDWVVVPSVATQPGVVIRGWSRRPIAIAFVLLLVMIAVGGALVVGARWLRPTPLLMVPDDRLAYTQGDSVFVADSDGSHPVRIAGPGLVVPAGCSASFEGTPWSPDGRHLAFRAFAGDCSAPAVYVTDPTGRVEASFPGSGWRVGWSPDSSRLVTSDVGGPDSISVYGLDGMRQARLHLPTGYGVYADYDPYWSPDGDVVLIPLRPDPGGDPRQIWELPLDGSAPRPADATKPWAHLFAASTPTGDRYAFVSYLTSKRTLVIASRDGTVVRSLEVDPQTTIDPTAIGISGQILSPAGNQVAFAWDPTGAATQIRLLDVGTGESRTLVDGKVNSSDGTQLSLFGFSSDGRRILFQRSIVLGTSSLWSVSIDGSGLTALGSDGVGYWQPPVAPTP